MNSYQSKNVVYGRVFADTLQAAYITRPAGPLIVAAKLRLSSDPAFNPQVGSVIADFTGGESNYSGYTAGGLSLTLTPGLNLSTTAVGAIGTGLFEALTASPFVPGSAYGYWVDDGTNVLMGERFADNAAAQFQAPGDFLDLTAVFPLQLQQAAA